MKKLLTFALFSGLRHENIEQLVSVFPVKKFNRGQTLLKQGEKSEKVFLLTEGRIGVQADSKTGLKTTIIFHEAPYIVGHVELWKDRPSLANVVAIEKCEALEMTKKDYLRMLQANHQVSINMVKILSNLIYETARDHHVRMFGQVDHLIANMLCSFARLYGEERGDGVRIRRDMSKSELALILGVARRTVIRALQDLEAQGLIQMDGKEVFVPNMAALQAKAFTAVL
ncbi:Crp/Fnr family transcriptional regulator [bacterium]|nr:Crp/Fnr family transcriptional regulator [bacterium]